MAHIELPAETYGIRGPMMVRPEVAIALNDMVSVLLHDSHTLSAGEREFIATAVSRANNCEYCSNIHAAIAAAHLGIDREEVLTDSDTPYSPQYAPSSDKLAALTRLALLVHNSGQDVTEAEVERARKAGASDTEIHDSILIGAAFCMFNRYVDGLSTPVPPDPKKYDEMGRIRAEQGYRAIIRSIIFIVLSLASTAVAFAVTGSISGTVKLSDSKEPAVAIRINDDAARRTVYTSKKGAFSIKGLDAGKHTLVLRGIEIQDTAIVDVEVKEGADTELEIFVQRRAVTSGEVVVFGASRKLQKISETPAAVTAITGQQIQRRARGNQLAKALEGMTGVDIVQNGATDFNVNTRGFNNSTNRRLLVLVDGRDVALQQIGAVEWNSFASSLSDFGSIELIRGPVASLYGANTFNGVLNLTTLSPREAQGTRISLLGGDYKTMRADVRHAGVMGDFSYKITAGRSQSYNLARNRFTGDRVADSIAITGEYASLWPVARESNSITSEDRETFATYGTLRMDYDIAENQTVLAEFGYSQFGNEMMLAGAGRIHVPQSEKPFARVAYHTDNLHVQTSFNSRRTIDTMRILAAPPGTIILDDSYDLNLDAQYTDTLSSGLSYVIGGQYQHLSVASNRTVFPDEPIIANIGGIYAQIEAKLMDKLSFVGSARYDNANIYPQQFSPRVALLYKPDADQVIRLSAGRSFQRANFSELYRKYAFRPAFTAQGAPVNFRPVQGRVDSALSALTGTQQRVFMGLYDTTVTNPRDPRGIQPAAWGVGNRDLNVEQNIGIELGYNAKIGSKLYVTADLYYNRLTNFISGFLPGVNPNFASWSSKSQLPADLQQYASVIDSIIYSQISPQDRARFTTYQGGPSFIVSNTNIGLVEQYGIELSATYQVTRELEVSANYSYFGANFVDVKTPNPFLPTGDKILSPNTSPNRINVSATYTVPMSWDVSAMFRYVEGFTWLAGDFQGFVPSYGVVNLNAGYHVTNDLRLGLAINNLLDNRYFEVFGGTILPRLTYLSATYDF